MLARDTLRAQIKLNETNNLARVSNGQNVRRASEWGGRGRSIAFIASGDDVNIGPLSH